MIVLISEWINLNKLSISKYYLYNLGLSVEYIHVIYWLFCLYKQFLIINKHINIYWMASFLRLYIIFLNHNGVDGKQLEKIE